MNEHGNNSSGQLESYLDDRLSRHEREAFEEALLERSDLREAVERQRAIDAALRRVLSPPDRDALASVARAAVDRAVEAPPPVAGVVSPRRGLAIAAAIAGTILGAWLFWDAVRPPPANPYDQPWRSAAQVYHDAVDDFTPQWVCRDDEEFARSFRDQLGQPLLLAPSEGVEALGLSVSHTISTRTLVLLARVGGEQVLVLVDRVEPDRGRLVADAELRVFRRRIGDLVLYELTPLEHPAVLEHFYDPGAPVDSNRRDSPS